MTTRPPFVTVICFDDGPTTAFADDEQTREFLADVMAEDAESYQLWSADQPGAMLKDITVEFCEAWAKLFDFGDGDEPDDILRPFPPFILAHRRAELIAAYRAAQEAA